jgi:DNA-binding MarR family transcriptional regulator
MNAAQLHKLARQLREVALEASSNGDEERVSAGELAIVEDVALHPKTSIGGISRRTRLAQSLVSRTVSAMRDADVFTTEPDPGDRRKLLVDIDSETRLHLFRDRGSRPIEGELLRALPGIEPGELERVVSMLEEVAGLFSLHQRNG